MGYYDLGVMSPNYWAGVNDQPISLSKVAQPSNLIAVTETADNTDAIGYIDFSDDNAWSDALLWAGHTQRSNYLFADGHVKALHPFDTDNANVCYWRTDGNLCTGPGGLYDMLQYATQNYQ
jgi:prepilin-type processing-associated H-X9-DG protein